MTDSPNVRLERAGIDRAEIDALADRIARTVNAKCDQTPLAEFDDADRVAIEQAVIDGLFAHIIEYGDSPDSPLDVPEWFERVADDFADPEATQAHSSVSLILGALAGRYMTDAETDVPEPAFRLSNALLAEKYQRHDEETTHE